MNSNSIRISSYLVGCFIVYILLSVKPIGCFANQAAPLFVLKSTSGQLHDLSQLRNDALTILYFDNANAHSNPRFLITIDKLRSQFPEATFNFWAICHNPESSVDSWVRKHGIEVPVLVDDGRVSMLFNAGLVLPALFFIGPDLQILDLLQGSEATVSAQLTLVAQYLFYRGFSDSARWLCEAVLNQDPDELAAQALMATALLQGGHFKEAEQRYYELSRRSELEAVPGKEGLARVYAARGEFERALNLTAKIAKLAKKSAVAFSLQGDINLQHGEASAAQKNYKAALKKKKIDTEEKARVTNQMGRTMMVQGKVKKAADYFKEAIEIAPLYAHARYNLGILYQTKGEWERALEVFERTLALEPESFYAASLAGNTAEILAFREDNEARQKMALIVTELAKNLMEGPWEWVSAEDDWTTEPLQLALIEPLEIVGVSTRAGYPGVANRLLRQRLMNSGRVKLVDPILLSQLLHEHKISADALATTKFMTKLGRVLGSRIVGLGAFLHGVGPSEFTYRLFDARLGEEMTRLEIEIFSHQDLEEKTHLLADRILETAVKSTPLQAYVVEVKGDRALLNLGAGQGVSAGRFFNVINERLFIEYKGKTLYPDPISFARLEVVQVEDDFCFARIVSQERPIKRNDKVMEDISDLIVSDDS